MKNILILISVITLTSCTNLQNICKESKRANGDITHVTKRKYRTVTIIIDGIETKIYGVPQEQELRNIPYCTFKGKNYWVMP